jgi:hypothetical protein
MNAQTAAELCNRTNSEELAVLDNIQNRHLIGPSPRLIFCAALPRNSTRLARI